MAHTQVFNIHKMWECMACGGQKAYVQCNDHKYNDIYVFMVSVIYTYIWSIAAHRMAQRLINRKAKGTEAIHTVIVYSVCTWHEVNLNRNKIMIKFLNLNIFYILCVSNFVLLLLSKLNVRCLMPYIRLHVVVDSGVYRVWYIIPYTL